MAAPDAPFKVRTVTAGVQLAPLADGSVKQWKDQLTPALALLSEARSRLSAMALDVQTVRITTNSFEDYCDVTSLDTALADLRRLVGLLPPPADDLPVLLSVGRVQSLRVGAFIPDIVKALPAVTCSLAVGVVGPGGGPQVDDAPEGAVHVPDMDAATLAATIIARIATETEGGEGNFNFAATCRCPPNIPYFPAGYHRGPTSFAVGFENPNMVVGALRGAGGDMAAASARLKAAAELHFAPVAELCEQLAEKFGVAYDGIDMSVAPSPAAASVVDAFEAFGSTFGGMGCLAVAAMITQTLKSVDLKLCGYSGLMLPPLEDVGLAARAAEGTYSVKDILMYSSVCGLGLDTVPIAGDAPVESIARLIADVCALAFRVSGVCVSSVWARHPVAWRM